MQSPNARLEALTTRTRLLRAVWQFAAVCLPSTSLLINCLPCWPAETVLSLLRNPDQCVYGSASVNNERSLDAGEDAFNRLSMEERGKVKEETLVNYGGRSRQGSYPS